jgi:2'-5' RNA ligase
MRVFIAVDVPVEIRNAFAAVQRKLEQSTNSARWVAAESIHITLKFIGEVPDRRVEDIHTALMALSWKPFTARIAGVGFFPGTRSPRVFWAGLEAPTMAGLAEELDFRMERIGFEKETRTFFRPHVTLARSKDTRLDASLVAAASEYREYEFGSFTVDRIFLFKSTLKPSGAVYEKLREYLL